MKHFLLTLITVFSFTLTNAQTINKEVIDARGNPKLLGKINKNGLTQPNYAKWFNKNYDNYLLNDKVVEQLKDSLNDYSIKVFLGTWCGDSKREVPRFYTILDQVNFPKKQLEVVALDRTAEAYKQSPNGEEKGLNIHRVPTFIFYKNGKEVNRIVEEPNETLERDILNIVSKKRYRPKYSAANYLGNVLNEKPLDSLNNKTNELRNQLSDYVKHSGELNTLGYVFLRAKELDKALLTFKINKEIFPYKINGIDSYAEALFEKKEYQKALKNYYKILSMKPEDENALKMVETINNLKKE